MTDSDNINQTSFPCRHDQESGVGAPDELIIDVEGNGRISFEINGEVVELNMSDVKEILLSVDYLLNNR